MSRALVILVIAVLSGRLSAQVSPTTPEAAQVRITEGAHDRVGEGVSDDHQLDNE